MEIPQYPTIEDVKRMLNLVKDNDVINIIFDANTDKFYSIPEKRRIDAIDLFVDMTTFVHRYLCFQSIGRGYKQENKPCKISDMFCHHVYSVYSLSEAMETLLKKGKRDKEYVDDFMKQFAYDMKSIHDFCLSVSNGELRDSISLYSSNNKIRTYTAVQNGLFGTKIQVTENNAL